MKSFVALLAVLLAAPVLAEKTPLTEISDPDMLKVMRDAKESNLSNAMAKSADDSGDSARHLAALMLASEAGVRAAVEDLRGLFGISQGPKPGSIEEAADDLHLASQMLAQKAKAFRKRADAVSMELPKADPQVLIPKRIGYPSRDRARDLKRAKGMLDNALKKTGKVELTRAHAELSDAAQSFLGELRNAERIIKSIRDSVRRERKRRPELAVASKRLDAYVERTSRDTADIEIETKLFDASLRMMRHDETAFDMGF